MFVPIWFKSPDIKKEDIDFMGDSVIEYYHKKLFMYNYFHFNAKINIDSILQRFPINKYFVCVVIHLKLFELVWF